MKQTKLEILTKELDLIKLETQEFLDLAMIRIEKMLIKSMDHTK